MKLGLRIGGRERTVELQRGGAQVCAVLDGRPLEADIVELGGGVYSILLAGRAFEVRVQPAPGTAGELRIFAGGQEFAVGVLDPRAWRGRRGGALEAEGRQQVTAPMPGKVVRVLVKAGDPVQAQQGLLVVEAMKMQNEIKSPKTGKVKRLLVSEGQAVNAGEVLAVVS